jgi:hypothetical protein
VVLGLKYCDEARLLSVLLERGVVSRVRTIELEVRVGSAPPLKVREVTQLLVSPLSPVSPSCFLNRSALVRVSRGWAS